MDWIQLLLDIPIIGALGYLVWRAKQKPAQIIPFPTKEPYTRQHESPERAQRIQRYISSHPDCVSYREAAKAVDKG